MAIKKRKNETKVFEEDIKETLEEIEKITSTKPEPEIPQNAISHASNDIPSGSLINPHSKELKEKKEVKLVKPVNANAMAKMIARNMGINMVDDNRTFLVNRMSGDRVFIADGMLKIGSNPNMCNYVIYGNNTVSRKHAQIVKEEDGIFLEDLNSTNGTYINGNKLPPNEEYEIFKGDIIKFSNVEFEVR